MKPSVKVDEENLYKIWAGKAFQEELKTVAGDRITVIDTGVRDPDTSGPDFKNARIRIGNFLYVGDIEIDTTYNNWKIHGHNIDTKYNKLILHICMFNKYNQPYVYTKEGRRVPTACLSEYINPSEIKKIVSEQASNENRNNKIRCSNINDGFNLGCKENLLKTLGAERFKKKCDKLFFRLKELSFLDQMNIKEPVINFQLRPEFVNREFCHDDFKSKEIWQQLFYELLFEALGYSKNKNIMINLAQAVPIGFYRKLGTDEKLLHYIEAALFNISGLVPKTIETGSTGYLNELMNEWEILKRIYDGKTFSQEDWYFFKLRPQNFPTLRLAGGARIIKSIICGEMIEKIIKKFEEIKSPNVLIKSLRSLFVIKAKGYWSEHFVFEKPAKVKIKYFVGISRANEILINVILPLFAVYFDVFGNKAASKKIVMIYNIIEQASENRIIREVAEGLNMTDYLKSTVYTQGMLELFRNYCSKDKCLECEIGKEVFS